MNKNNARDYLPLVQAMAEGKTVQLSDGHGGWIEGEIEFHYPASEYRIKPEPMELFVVMEDDDTGSRIGFYDEELAEQCARRRSGNFVRRFREVLE